MGGKDIRDERRQMKGEGRSGKGCWRDGRAEDREEGRKNREKEGSGKVGWKDRR